MGGIVIPGGDIMVISMKNSAVEEVIKVRFWICIEEGKDTGFVDRSDIVFEQSRMTPEFWTGRVVTLIGMGKTPFQEA